MKALARNTAGWLALISSRLLAGLRYVWSRPDLKAVLFMLFLPRGIAGLFERRARPAAAKKAAGEATA